MDTLDELSGAVNGEFLTEVGSFRPRTSGKKNKPENSIATAVVCGKMGKCVVPTGEYMRVLDLRPLFLIGMLLLSLGSAVVAKQDPKLTPDDEWNNLTDIMRISYEQGDYPKAAELCLQSLKRAETHGPDDPRIGSSLQNLASIYMKQGKFADAEAAYKRGLDIEERVYGSDSDKIVKALNGLAEVYLGRSNFAESEKLMQRALSIAEKNGKPTDVASCLLEIGRINVAQANYVKAEPLIRRGIEIREHELGPDHRQVGTALAALGALYREEHKLKEAEETYVRVLTIDDKILGPDHPEVAIILNNLAALSSEMNKLSNAEAYYRRALSVSEKVHGKNHMDVALVLSNLGSIYYKQDKFAEAKKMQLESLAIQKNISADELFTSHTLHDLAGVYMAEGKYKEAEALLEKALAVREQKLGPNHPDTVLMRTSLTGAKLKLGKVEASSQLQSQNAAAPIPAGVDAAYAKTDKVKQTVITATVYMKQGRLSEAEALFRQVISEAEKSGSTDNMEFVLALHNLGAVCMSQKKYAEVENIYKRELGILEKTPDAEASMVATLYNNLGMAYSNTGRYGDAETALKHSLMVLEKLYGSNSNNPEIAQNLHNLGALYAELNRNAEALPLLLRGEAIKEKTFGPNSVEITNSLTLRARIAEKDGKFADAETLYKRALAINEAAKPNTEVVEINLHDLGTLYLQRQQYALAEPLIKKMFAMKEKRLSTKDGDYPYFCYLMSLTYHKVGKDPQALEICNRLMPLSPQNGFTSTQNGKDFCTLCARLKTQSP